MNPSISISRTLKEYTIITLALFVDSLAWTAFIIPSKIVGGGVAGIGTIIYFTTGIPVAVPLLIINAFLILLGIKMLGKSFGIKTIYCILVLSGFMAIQQYYITEPVVPEKFMAAIIGGVLSGVSIGLIFSQGGSTGGTDILAMIINKYRNISQGRIILYFDLFIIASAYFIFYSIETVVYGYVVMVAISYAIDVYLTGTKRSIQMMIFSKENKKIADKIGTEIGRGVTFLKGKGWYSGQETEIVMVVARKYDSPAIFRAIKEIDPDAFISMGSVTGVYGEGFDKLR